MTTDSDGYHTEMKFKRKVLYHFLCLKVILQKTKFDISAFYLIYSFLEKYIFCTKKSQEKFKKKAHIYVRQYVQIGIF